MGAGDRSGCPRPAPPLILGPHRRQRHRQPAATLGSQRSPGAGRRHRAARRREYRPRRGLRGPRRRATGGVHPGRV